MRRRGVYFSFWGKNMSFGWLEKQCDYLLRKSANIRGKRCNNWGKWKIFTVPRGKKYHFRKRGRRNIIIFWTNMAPTFSWASPKPHRMPIIVNVGWFLLCYNTSMEKIQDRTTLHISIGWHSVPMALNRVIRSTCFSFSHFKFFFFFLRLILSLLPT